LDEDEPYEEEDDANLIDDEEMAVGFSNELRAGSLEGEIQALEAEAQGPSE